MTAWRLVLQSLLHHWRTNLAVMLGVAAATAVLTGALLVGDSMRGSLRHLTLDRLGQIDEVILTDRFFRVELAEELAADEQFDRHFSAATPVILLPQATAAVQEREDAPPAAAITVVGCSEAFWQLGAAAGRPRRQPGPSEIVLNRPLADRLGAEVGDRIVLRLPSSNQVPAESALGRKGKGDRTRSTGELELIEIVPAEGLGRFNLQAAQRYPHNAYVALPELQFALKQNDRANCLLIAGHHADRAPAEASEALVGMLRPKLADFGVSIHRQRREYVDADDPDGPPQLAYEYLQITTDRMLFDPVADEALQRATDGTALKPVLTYLANSIERVGGDGRAADDAAVPYSTVAAVDLTDWLEPDAALKADATGGESPIVLNHWTADQLGATVGDRIRLRFFDPETTHARVQEQSAEFTLVAVAPIDDPVEPATRRRPAVYREPPTRWDDPHWTPTVAGITDEASIEDWDPPFPFDHARIRDEDETYWDNHRTTPKAFIPLESGRALWGSRFGQTTAYRTVPMADDGPDEAALAETLRSELDGRKTQLGFAPLHVKRDGLAASVGATPFNVLFLGFSMFLIAAAAMLVMLLFRLGIEQRVAQIGLLLAVGMRRRRVARLLSTEAALVAAGGGVLGTLGGVGYAWLMLAGLRTVWLDAVVTPFLTLHVTFGSLAVGGVSGLLLALATIAWSIRRAGRVAVPRLLAGQSTEQGALLPARTVKAQIAVVILLPLAVIAGVAGAALQGEAQAGAFFGSGALLLCLLLTWMWIQLRRAGVGASAERFSLARLTGRNIARNPTRSTLTIGLTAAATFLIVAISAFRLDPTDRGAGGFDLIMQTDRPLFDDLSTPDGRKKLLGDEADALDGGAALSMRVSGGDDASCRNLYQAQRPRAMSVSSAMAAYFDDKSATGFQFAAAAPAEKDNPWRLLTKTIDGQRDVVPVILDKNTAMYALHLYGGVGERFEVSYQADAPVTFEVVGLLSNSVVQGSLLIDERRFRELFPDVAGYQYFLVAPPEDDGPRAADVLRRRLADQGVQVAAARDVLSDLLAVQNTYLGTFQSLGALGLLLGTFGLATVQLRNILERRGELALMRAAGFRRRRLASMVLAENALLLVAGLGVGVAAALAAVLPHMLLGGAHVPLGTLAGLLAVVLAIGLIAGRLAARATLRAPLLQALRGD